MAHPKAPAEPRESWADAGWFFAQFVDESDVRGRMVAVNLRLLRGARRRWSSQLDCFAVMGFALVFSPRAAPYSLWVRVEPRPDTKPDPTVSIALWDGERRPPGAPRAALHRVIAGDICRAVTAPIVLESFLVQIGDEDRANAASALTST